MNKDIDSILKTIVIVILFIIICFIAQTTFLSIVAGICATMFFVKLMVELLYK